MNWSNSAPRLGLAHSAYLRGLLNKHPGLVDYVETPFELLQHDPTVFDLDSTLPVVLHCATLSLAGSVRATPEIIRAIQNWIEKTQTPWLGEHLSFITANRTVAGSYADDYAPDQPYNLGYTVSPIMNATSVASVVRHIKFYRNEISVPMLLENSPIYFRMPGTTMRQVEFISEICARSQAGLLLDVTHFYISARNMGLDPFAEIKDYPLEKVVEIHLSGASIERDALWDDHANPASEEIFALFRFVLGRTRPRAVTLEYNWSARFPEDVLLREVQRTKEALSCIRPSTIPTRQ